MSPQSNISLVTTIQERCRVCYTCVRECPAKAIRVADGQAEVVSERCIGCGSCVRVCSQNAKRVLNNIGDVEHLLHGNEKVVALVAPSFPAEFGECDHEQFVGMVRQLGFDMVCEVAFGADLVAKEYKKLVDSEPDQSWIATTCPAIVRYVERYHPGLVPKLAPIVSPMIASARAVKAMNDAGDWKVVFIGPCIAKKCEARSQTLSHDIDEVLTFDELRQMLLAHEVTLDQSKAQPFDPPHGGVGRVFALSRGLLQTAGLQEDLMTGEVVTAEGRQGFMVALKDYEANHMDTQLLELLSCHGCIMGVGITSEDAPYHRRSRVSQYARQQTEQLDKTQWQSHIDCCETVDLSRQFLADDQRIDAPSSEQLATIMHQMGKFNSEDELNCGACGYDTCAEHSIAIYKGLAETEMCLPNTIDRIRDMVYKLTSTNRELADTREQLIQSEKLASMGQLAAGIAHEVNNPLSVVLMYAHLLVEDEQLDPALREDLKMIVDQASRCRKIVGGLLDFARQNKVVCEPTDFRELVDHALRTIPHPKNVVVSVKHDLDHPMAEIDRDQIIQVLVNLITNAFAAMDQIHGTLTVCTSSDKKNVKITIADTGIGIPSENLSKIFDPFFTTKQIGKGTGLGLAVTYGIIKMHQGDISVQSNTDPQAGPTGTTFKISLPRKGDTL